MSLYSDRDRLRQVERWLRQNYPIRSKVVVRVREIRSDDLGVCTVGKDGSSFWISIRKGSPIHEQLEALLHEWSHLGSGGKRLNHGRGWGRRWQRIYQHWFDGGGSEESRAL